MISPERIIVALDKSDPQEVTTLLHSLMGEKVWIKIGMELYYSLGPNVVHQAKDLGFKVFLDLKLHDIPNTVEKSMRALSKLPIDMINVHAAGGSEMMKRAAGTLKDLDPRPKLIAVTQLTSTTEAQMRAEQKINSDLLESVTHYAKLAQESGCDGVVSSAQEATAIKLICGSKFLTVTPGIRPAGSASNDQQRITTPMEALKMGVDLMVIGRPITQAQDPKAALKLILEGK